MTHRVDQVLDAIVALMPSTAAAFKHRTLSLDPDEGELPARSVRYGEEDPADDDGSSNLAFIDVMLTVEIDHKLQADDEDTAKAQLLEMCRETHVALMADDSLGLNFVIGIGYAGASAPEIDAEKEYTVAVRTSRWRVYFRTSKTDPAA